MMGLNRRAAGDVVPWQLGFPLKSRLPPVCKSTGTHINNRFSAEESTRLRAWAQPGHHELHPRRG
jgi:hypothetical protein